MIWIDIRRPGLISGGSGFDPWKLRIGLLWRLETIYDHWRFKIDLWRFRVDPWKFRIDPWKFRIGLLWRLETYMRLSNLSAASFERLPRPPGVGAVIPDSSLETGDNFLETGDNLASLAPPLSKS